MIYHPSIPIDNLRSVDILLLLALGAVAEGTSRLSSFFAKKRTPLEKDLQLQVTQLKFETSRMREKGQPAFVETSKLERLLLQKEKAYSQEQEARLSRLAHTKRISRNLLLILMLIVFLVYFGIPILTIKGSELDALQHRRDSSATAMDADDEYEHQLRAVQFFKGMFFPLSYIGFGMRMANFGLSAQHAGSALGALVVFWSAQSTVGHLADSIEALLLR